MSSLLFGINLIYLLVFASLYIQLPGLIGDNGVAPVRLLHVSTPNSLDDFLLGIPSIVRFSKYLNLSEYHAAELLVVVGFALSFLSLAVPRLRGTLPLLVQWISFFSVVKVCPGMADWKWTALLIEGGFLCFLLSIKLQKYSRSTSGIIVWLIRWLLFREAVASGFTKLVNINYHWWDLSAMEHYFSTQISPTPAAWYCNLAPTWILRSLSAIVIAMDIFVPFLFLIPIYGLQMFSFYAKFMFHANLMLTGNYGIYNLLCIVLSFALVPEIRKRKGKPSTSRRIASFAITTAVLAVLAYVVWIFFDVHRGVEALRIAIPRRQFIDLWNVVIYYTIPIATAFFVLRLLSAICRSLSKKRCIDSIMDFTGVVLVGLLGSGLFVASLVPFAGVDNSGSVGPLPRFAYELASALRPFHLANDYRFFHQVEKDALMRMGPQRTTLVLEGAMNENGPWKELSFRHVPNAPAKQPSIIPGHWPVIDFEAALSGQKAFENSPIVAALVYRVVTNQKDVLPLLEPSGFPDGPKFVQIKKYSYTMTQSADASQWWKRKLLSVYLPPTQASTARLTRLMKNAGIVGKQREHAASVGLVSSALDTVRAMVGQPSNLNGFYVVLVAILLANRLIF